MVFVVNNDNFNKYWYDNDIIDCGAKINKLLSDETKIDNIINIQTYKALLIELEVLAINKKLNKNYISTNTLYGNENEQHNIRNEHFTQTSNWNETTRNNFIQKFNRFKNSNNRIIDKKKTNKYKMLSKEFNS